MRRPSPASRRTPGRATTRSELGYRRLRGLPRLAVPERPVRLAVVVEPCAWRPAEERLLDALREAR
jgi:hypothetical protein